MLESAPILTNDTLDIFPVRSDAETGTESSSEAGSTEICDPLWSAYAANPSDVYLRNKLVERYIPLAKSIARRIHSTLSTKVDVQDLISEAMIGVVESVDRFRLEAGISFKRFSLPRIRGAILDSMRRNSWIPRHTYENILKVEAGFRSFEALQKRKPTNEELASHMNMVLSVVKRSFREGHNTVLRRLSEFNGASYDGEKMGSRENPLIDEFSSSEVEDLMEQEEFEELIRVLTKTEKVILTLYYRRELTFREIGEIIGCTESNVCHNHSVALKYLRYRCSLHKDRDDFLGDVFSRYEQIDANDEHE